MTFTYEILESSFARRNIHFHKNFYWHLSRYLSYDLYAAVEFFFLLEIRLCIDFNRCCACMFAERRIRNVDCAWLVCIMLNFLYHRGRATNIIT
jgi:hypothetical protein